MSARIQNEIILLRQQDQAYRHTLRLAPVIEPLSRLGFHCKTHDMPQGIFQRWTFIRQQCRNKIVVLPAHLYSYFTLLCFRSVGAKLVLDLDDGIWLRPDQDQPNRTSWTRQWRFDRHMSHCTLVAANPQIYSHLEKTFKAPRLWPNIIHNPCPIDSASLNLFKSRLTNDDSGNLQSSDPKPANSARNKLRLLWLGTATTQRYLRRTLVWLANQDSETVQLTVVSDREPQQQLPNLYFVRWSPDNEQRELKNADLGIMPQPDSPWSQFKSGYKCLRYCSVGLPVLCNRFGNSTTLLPTSYPFIADNEEQFFNLLDQLLAAPIPLKPLAVSIHRKASQDFAQSLCAQSWAELFAALTA